MDWKKHMDTIVILGAIITTFLWINHNINSIDRRLTIIETVMIMKNIMPCEMVAKGERNANKL